MKLIEYSQNNTVESILNKTLDEIEELTYSKIGFYHFVNEDTGIIELQKWSTRTISQFCHVNEDFNKHYPIASAGVWVDCVRERKAVVHNDYQALTHKKGLPEGHAEVIRQLVVPVIRKKKIVAILGVGNKSTNYTKEDIDIVTQFADMAWDIAEKKIVEEKVNKLYKGVEQSPASVIITDTNGNIEYINKKFSEVTGYSPEDAIGKNPRILKSGNQDKEFYENLWNTILRGDEWQGEMLNKKKNGDLYWELATISPVKNENGETINFIAIKEDITENRELKKLNEMLLSSLPHPAMYIRGKDRVVLAANKIALDFGVTIGGQCWREFGKTEYISEKYKEIAKKFPGFVPPEYGVKCSFCQGDECFINGPDQNNPEVHAFGLIWDTYWIKVSNDVYLHYAVDITERKKAEQALRESEEKHRFLIENTENIFWSYDIIKNRWTYVAPQVKRILGYDPEEWTDNDFWENNIHQEDRKQSVEYCLKTTAKGADHSFEYRFKKKDGNYAWIYDEVKVVMQDGKPSSMWGFMKDISEKKTYEEILKNYERIFNHTNDMLCIIGYDGYFKDINPTWYKNTGWKKDEIFALPFINFINESDKTKTKKAFSDACNGKSILYFENRFKCNHDVEKWFLWDFIPYKSEKIIIGVARDNTRNVTLEKEKQLFNKLLIERVKELTFLNTFSKFVYRSNTKMPQLFKQIINLMPHAFQHPDKTYLKITGQKLNLKTINYKKTKYEISESFRTKTYGLIKISVCVDPYKGVDNQVFFDEEISLLKTVAEILSNHIQKTEAIEKEKLTEQKFFELFNNVNDIVFNTNIIGNILNINNEFEKQLGYKHTPELNFFSILTPTGAKHLKEQLVKVIKGKQEKHNIDIDVVTKKGKVKTFEVRLNIKYTAKKIQEIFGIARDVTKLRESQNILMRTIIETEEKERKHFAEELHDGIGPLLSGINMYMEKIQSRKNLSAEDAELLKYCNELVHDVINQIRIISNDLMPHLLSKYGLSTTLNSFVDKLKPLEKVNIKITGQSINNKDIPYNTGVTIYRALTELINNTLKHSRAKNILINLKKGNNAIVVNFEDDGTGFSIKELESKKDYGGMGIKNIISRIKSIKGNVTFLFEGRSGVIVKIDIPL